MLFEAKESSKEMQRECLKLLLFERGHALVFLRRFKITMENIGEPGSQKKSICFRIFKLRGHTRIHMFFIHILFDL